ncbi:HNH endonuclease signature motif containing protein [Aequorivita nionensis]|uniref:HNH endonuclease signature motif containing protein n=1 Tax=Aequorivita nionensis TaxID=1287690 RepID=UPI0039659AEB
MRAVNKGNSPRTYTRYQDARNDLGGRIDWHCSYCEMAITNMIEVEHIVPRDNGGAPLDWENFLLSCKYCNTVKGARNPSRTGYIWPDRDNSDLAFDYSEAGGITAKPTPVRTEALATIELMGLDRNPGMPNEPTKADSRWIFRLQSWQIAKYSFENWQDSPSPQMANQIALTAKGMGFYSIWVKVFENEPEVLEQLRSEIIGTHYVIDSHNNRIPRPSGII